MPYTAISLNTWGDATGKVIGDIARLAYNENADVVFLQEVHNSGKSVPRLLQPRDPGKRIGPINTKLYAEVVSALGNDYISYFAPQMFGYCHDSERSDYGSLEYGNATFVRRGRMHSYRDRFIYGRPGKVFDASTKTPAGKTGQAIDFYDEKGKITFAHVHGAWYNSDKTTHFPWRSEQIEGIERLIVPDYETLEVHAKQEDYRPRVVLVGDLNVVTESKTVRRLKESKVFGRVGGCHLNSRCGKWRTRTKFYTGEFKEAGHAFTSNCLEATLDVDLDVNSDHGAFIVRVA